MLQPRDWTPAHSRRLVAEIVDRLGSAGADAIERTIHDLIAENRAIHDRDCINLNPATNVMNPRAEAAMAAGLGVRPSLGHPGDKYEMGLEAIERIEVIAASLAAETFGARFVEHRVPSGSIANLYVFMAVAAPGEAIIAPPAEIGGHITHHLPGAAGRYGIVTHPAPVDPATYGIDVQALRALAHRVRPRLITVGGSLNLFPPPIAAIREVADEVGSLVLYDAAHMSGMIAGHAWPQPLAEGAHVMSMSTYKSLGGPPSGLIVTNDAALAERLDAIAYPGLTANFDVGKTASLALALLDWRVHGSTYAAAMAATAHALGTSLAARGLPVFARDRGITTSHQFAIEAARYGGGQAAAKRLRAANILTSGIGLPLPPVPGDANGIRFGTPEIVRLGMTAGDMPELAALIADALEGARPLDAIASDVSALRGRLSGLHYVRS